MQTKITTNLGSFSDRFWRNVVRNPKGCWIWNGSRIPRGYGQIHCNGRSQLAHRVSWELHYGPIPIGVLVLHHCDNRPCVRPGHLFLGNGAANIADMIQKGRSLRGEANPNAKLTVAIVQSIRERIIRRGTIAALSREFGVSPDAISAILHRKRWKHVLP